MSKIVKICSKHQKYFKYILTLYQNIQLELILMLSLGILRDVIQFIYDILFCL